MRRREERHERPEVVAKSHAEVGDGARLDRQQRGPPEEKAPHRTERLFEVVVLPARLRKHGAQFGVGQCAGDGDQAPRDPQEHCQRGMGYFARHEGRGDENGGTEDGSRRYRGHVPQPERPGKAHEWWLGDDLICNCQWRTGVSHNGGRDYRVFARAQRRRLTGSYLLAVAAIRRAALVRLVRGLLRADLWSLIRGATRDAVRRSAPLARPGAQGDSRRTTQPGSAG